MTDQNLRFPPDSTGKRVGHIAYIDIDYASGTIPFVVGDRITTPTTLLSGTVIKVTGTTSTGAVYALLDAESPAAVNIGEALRVNSVTNALATSAGVAIYVQKTTTFGANNPGYGQFVDADGAATVRFAEGSPQFDAFGRTQVSHEHTLEEYIMRYDILAPDFEDVIVGTASLTHIPNMSGVLLSVGTGATDKVQRTTHQYHPYQAGKSQLIEFTVKAGDLGKANLVRAVWYGDDENGIGLRMNGLGFEYVNRSKSTGVVVDQIVSSTVFNGDRLDGSKGTFNISGIALDFSKDNIYWFDLQWLGAGRVRFGAFIGGRRITMHSDENANVNNGPYMSTGSLPLRYEMYNTGITASTSEMTFFCAAVKTEGEFDPFRRTFGFTADMVTATSNTVPVVAVSLRPAQTFNGLDNRIALYPSVVQIYNKGVNPIIVDFVRNATITAGVWVAKGGESSAETNMTGTAAGGSISKTFFIKGGECKDIEFRSFEENRRGLRRRSIVTGYQNQSIQIRTMEATQTADVRVALNWDEVRA